MALKHLLPSSGREFSDVRPPQSPHRTKGRSQCVALSLSLPPERHPCCRRWRLPPTCRSRPSDVRAAVGRGLRRLVSARRYRLQQSARQSPEQRATMPATPSSDQSLGFNTAGIFGLGVGYQFNNWFRADVTGEYRGNSQFFGTDRITFTGGVGTDTYHGSKSEWVVLANAYVDLGTWWCMTPFIGAGVGGARVSIANFTDQGIANARRRRAAGPRLRRQRVEVEFRLGAARRSCLQGHAELHRRTRLSLPRYGRRPDRRSPTFDGTNSIAIRRRSRTSPRTT